VVDRPKGSPHPRHKSFQYPLDYGYLQGTRSPDGDGLDVWIGSLARQALAGHTVTGIIATLDLGKRDAELKLLIGCTTEEAQIALAAHNRGQQTGLLVSRGEIREDDTQTRKEAL
jgi:inorganic pyrophosphatase